MMKTISKLFAIKCLYLFCFILPSFGASISNTEKFDLSIANDASPAVLKCILNAQQKHTEKIIFEKGVYNFYPDKAFETFAFISNHGDGLIRTAFPILNLKNLTIDGQGSTFIFHGIMVPFFLENSENITIKNLSVDWKTPFNSEGLVVANDIANKTFDLQISKDYPYEIRNEQLVFVKEHYEHSLGQTILYDPIRKAIAFNTEKYTPLTQTAKTAVGYSLNTITYPYKHDFSADKNIPFGTENRITVKQLEPGLVKIYGHIKPLPPIGTILVSKGEQGKNRVAPAFRVSNCKDFYATNVNVHHAGGMGLIAENSENLTLDRFNVTPSQGRMVSTTADATHFVGCRGKVSLLNCTFTNQLDDASNIHGTYQEVIDRIDDYTLGVRIGHFQQQNFEIGRVNDTIGLVRLANSFDAYNKLTLKSIQKINGRYHLITFNQKIPESVKTGDLIENLSAYPELLVQNCKIANNRARGLLISTPKKTVIDHNFFSTEMEAILLPVESGSWFESGSAANVTISNNTFQDCQHSGYERGVIKFATDDESEHVAFKNIVIENNKFNQFDNLILQITNVDGLTFKGNTITNSGTFPQLYPGEPAIVIDYSRSVSFENNKYFGKAKVILKDNSKSKNQPFK